MSLKLCIISKLPTLVLGAMILTAPVVGEGLGNPPEFLGSPLGSTITRLKTDVQLLAQVQATQELMRCGAHHPRFHV